MTVNGSSAYSLLDSVLAADSTRQKAGVELLKKAQDLESRQGMALVEMLEQAGSAVNEHHLDVYA